MVDLDKIATEQRNAASANIDKVSTLEMVKIINNEDKKVAEAITPLLPKVAAGVELIAQHLQQGGRLFYVGSGTSGRLGILDAAECPPTFSTDPEMVQGIIAGGTEAIFRAQEGAEDSSQGGESALQAKNITKKDVVIGLTASGRTPFVAGALAYAQKQGAPTISITCTSYPEVGKWADISLEALVGPEVVTGSTRMKAGTAQKMLLNMLSTGAMIRLGKVYGNLMVDVKASNKKLQARALRIVRTATGCSEEVAEEVLKKTKGRARDAIDLLGRGHE